MPLNCNKFLPTLDVTKGIVSDPVFGRVFHAGLTEDPGASAQIVAELGYGPLNSDPRDNIGWTWIPATFNIQIGNDDEYMATFLINSVGTYSYTYRFSFDDVNFTAADLDGAGSDFGLSFDPNNLGVMTVVPEPASLALLVGAAVTLLSRRRR